MFTYSLKFLLNYLYTRKFSYVELTSYFLARIKKYDVILNSFVMVDSNYSLLVAKNLHQLRNFTWKLVAFAIYMPLIGAIVGLATSYAIGLDVGTGTLFMVLCASASYIAVPAAMRLILPEAKAAIYLPK